MKPGLLKKYWRVNSKTLIVAFIFSCLLAYFVSPSCFLFFFISCARDYYHYDAKLFESNRLKARGLTEEDSDNIRFVKKWEEIRAKGKLSYCLFDGGVIQGSILAVFLCLIAIAIYGVQKLFAQPSYMFIVTGGAYLIGGFIASLLYRHLWKQNEQRFKRLTQFEHFIF